MQRMLVGMMKMVVLGVGVLCLTGIVWAAPADSTAQQPPQDQQARVDKAEQKTLRDSLKVEAEKPVETKNIPSAGVETVQQPAATDKDAMKKAEQDKKLQDKAAKEAEKKALEDKKLQDKAAKEAEKKALEDKKLQDKAAKEAEKKALADKKLQDKAAKEAEKQRLKDMQKREKEMALADKKKKQGKPSFKEFYIYKNAGYDGNHFTPTGWMGDIEDMKFTVKSFIKPKEGMSCIKIDYSANKSRGAGWAGIYWQEPANNWGVEKKGFDLTGSKKLTFYARGERGGEVVDAFKVGGITGTYPDSSESSVGPIMLTKKWEKYTIDLKNKDLSHIIGGFMFVVSAESNPDGMIFYIDDIKFES